MLNPYVSSSVTSSASPLDVFAQGSPGSGSGVGFASLSGRCSSSDMSTSYPRRRTRKRRLQFRLPGGVPERPKGTGCNPVGSAYGGSNPPAPTPPADASEFTSDDRSRTRSIAVALSNLRRRLLASPSATAATTTANVQIAKHKVVRSAWPSSQLNAAGPTDRTSHGSSSLSTDDAAAHTHRCCTIAGPPDARGAPAIMSSEPLSSTTRLVELAAQVVPRPETDVGGGAPSAPSKDPLIRVPSDRRTSRRRYPCSRTSPDRHCSAPVSLVVLTMRRSGS